MPLGLVSKVLRNGLNARIYYHKFMAHQKLRLGHFKFNSRNF